MQATQREPWRVRRGQVYEVELGFDHRGERLARPVLVVQNDIGNDTCHSVLVVPLTPKLDAKSLLFTVRLEAGSQSGLAHDHLALFAQVRALARYRFTPENYLGFLDRDTMALVDEALKLSLGLNTLQELRNRLPVGAKALRGSRAGLGAHAR